MRRSSPLIDAWEAMKRWASSASDISRLNSATGRGRSLSSATFSAMFVTSADLPIDGRAAMMIEVAGLEAAGDLVEVREARRRAGERLALGRELLPLVDLVVQDVADLAEVLLAVVVGDLEHRALGPLDELARLRLVAVDARPGSRRSPSSSRRRSACSLTIAP